MWRPESKYVNTLCVPKIIVLTLGILCVRFMNVGKVPAIQDIFVMRDIFLKKVPKTLQNNTLSINLNIAVDEPINIVYEELL